MNIERLKNMKISTIEILQALGIDKQTIEKVYLPTQNSLIIKFLDGHIVKFHISKGGENNE